MCCSDIELVGTHSGAIVAENCAVVADPISACGSLNFSLLKILHPEPMAMLPSYVRCRLLRPKNSALCGLSCTTVHPGFSHGATASRASATNWLALDSPKDVCRRPDVTVAKFTLRPSYSYDINLAETAYVNVRVRWDNN